MSVCEPSCLSPAGGAREHPSSAASSSVMFELGQPSSTSLALSRQVSSTHCSVRHEFAEILEFSEGGTIAANSSFRCCSIVTSSDMSSEKHEPSIVTHDCEPVWDTAIGSVANAFINSDRVTAHGYSEDSNWVAERTRVFNSKLIPWSSR